MTELVQAWNGKWHIFEHDLHKLPIQPVSQTGAAKPVRQVALTGCGLSVYAKNTTTIRSYRDVYEHWTRINPSTGRPSAGRRLARSYCKNCLIVLQLRHPIGAPDPGPTETEIEETRTGLLKILEG